MGEPEKGGTEASGRELTKGAEQHPRGKKMQVLTGKVLLLGGN